MKNTKVILDKHHSFKDDDYSKYPILCMIEGEIDDLDLLIKFNDKLYSPTMSAITKEGNFVFIKEIKLKEEIESQYNTEDFECPYCGNTISDSWECEDSEDFECEYCGGEFFGEKEVSVTYRTKPIKRDNVDIITVK